MSGDDEMDDKTNVIAADAWKERKKKLKEAEHKPIDVDDQQVSEAAKQYFTPLGHDRGRFYFMTSRGRQVIEVPVRSLSQKPILLSLAPLQFWEMEFPNDKGFTGKAVDAAVNWLVTQGYAKGVFRMEMMRGRGAWWDDGRAVIHAGDRLIVDQEEVPLLGFDSRYVYEALPSLPVDLTDPLSAKEAYRLLHFLRELNWEQDFYGTLAAGWVTTALVCGALSWRPHVMITGPSSSGKSWVTERLRRLLGDFVVAAKGESTEAGIRQRLQADALPVMFDEFEGEDQRTEEQVKKVMAMARSSSAELGGDVVKGGKDGTAARYTLRSAFLFAAIRVPIQQTADENRITVLTLKGNSKEDRNRFAAEVAPLAEGIFTEAWAARFRARVISKLPTLRQNIEVFADVAGARLGNQRMGDQLAPLIAGAYLMASDEVISREAAEKWLSQQDLGEQEEIVAESDEEKLLNALLEAVIRIPLERGSADLSVGELIKSASRQNSGVEIAPDIAITTLARNGILVDPSEVVISNTHRGIKRLLQNTSWAVGWGRILKRIDGARSTPDKRSFAGAVSRAVGIPIGHFPG